MAIITSILVAFLVFMVCATLWMWERYDKALADVIVFQDLAIAADERYNFLRGKIEARARKRVRAH